MKNEPLVSVIINCYNGEKYLRETIDSVINQTYKNWEIVFWDNQSTDSSRLIVESFNSDKIHYYYAPIHTTLGEARNLAVEKANGEYAAFLDCDDLWLPDKLSMQMNMANDKTKVVFTPFEIICEDSGAKLLPFMKDTQKKCLKYAGLQQNFYNILLKGNFICVSSLLFKKDLFLKIGGIDSSIRHNADFDLLIKTSQLTNFACTKFVGIKYRIHPTNLSNETYLLGYYENRLIFGRCPNSPSLKKTIKANETHIILHEMYGKRGLISIFKAIKQKGSITELISIVLRQIRIQICK